MAVGSGESTQVLLAAFPSSVINQRSFRRTTLRAGFTHRFPPRGGGTAWEKSKQPGSQAGAPELSSPQCDVGAVMCTAWSHTSPLHRPEVPAGSLRRALLRPQQGPGSEQTGSGARGPGPRLRSNHSPPSLPPPACTTFLRLFLQL